MVSNGYSQKSQKHSNLRKSLKKLSKRMKLKPLKVEKKEIDKVMDGWKFQNEMTRKTVEFRLLKAKRLKMKTE